MVRRVTKEDSGTFLKFLGTAGARFVMIKQLRASGGIWISCAGTNVLIDPGPGSIVRCNASRPKLDPSQLDAIVLTHRHLDHCGDINVMIEAMTEGGFRKRGAVFCPQDALGDDPVILRYVRTFPEKIELLRPEQTYEAGNFIFRTSPLHMHNVETYGLKFRLGNQTVGLLSDTRYFKGLEAFYKTDVLIIGVVFFKPRPEIDHLSLDDAKGLISALKPQKAILSHFGMSMLSARPSVLAQQLSRELRAEVVCAYDGMMLTF
ncbi:MAG: MBL fold metallo-hydrolase [Candidatus Omnitrophota bacterium]|jgi:phosphoribosyl 1,2-cyclic phosphodiesterase|nr:MAG: MBL fold metallo-hydrolase [Candidatus Omnitrophota bacterium]